jgi:hypothetical protein
MDKKSNWVQARYGWVTQLLLHFDDVCLDPFLKESTGLAVPLWFNKTRLRLFNKLVSGGGTRPIKNVRLALIWENKCCTQEMMMLSTIAKVTLTVILKVIDPPLFEPQCE